MNLFDTSLDVTAPVAVVAQKAATTKALTLRQKSMLVLVTILSSFAVGSIPVVYAFTVAQTHNQTTTQTPIIRGEMF